ILSNETLPSRTYEKNTCSDCILSYVDRHYRENITLASIAEHMHLSAMYLSHKFKQETGMTIKTYINLRRITAAKDLISEGRKATSVYDKCGYSDYSAFYRSFTKYVGMTPNAYKHQYDNK
ncbi:MAG: helix-turn-helix domain-containing protein, partial [Candidatus Ornithomonoglobus sp.]